MSVPEQKMNEQRIHEQEVKRPDSSGVTTGTVEQLGTKNLAQLQAEFEQYAQEIGQTVTTAENRAAKVWAKELRVIRNILLQNANVSPAVRISNETMSGIMVKAGVFKPRTSTGRTAGAMSRPNALTKWSFHDVLGTSEAAMRTVRALKPGVEYNGKTYHSPLDMLEQEDIAFSRVYDMFAALIRAASDRRRRKDLAQDPADAAEGAAGRLAVKVKVKPSKEYPKGYKMVKVLDDRGAAFTVLTEMLNRFAGSWEADEKQRLSDFLNAEKPVYEDEPDGEEEEAAA